MARPQSYNEYLWQYDDNGNPEQEINERNKYTRYEYDKQNRLVFVYQQFDAREIKTEYQYDENGNRIHTIDARNNDTEIKYDTWNRPYQVIDPEKYETTTGYDGNDNQVSLTDGNGHARTWQRDLRGLVLTETDAEDQSTRYTYDANGNVETIADANNTVTKNTYDGEDRLLSTTEAFGTAQARIREILSRDRMGNIISEKDFNDNISNTEYNVLNLVEKVFNPAPFDSQYTHYTYYNTGKVNTVTNARSFATTYEYDDLNRQQRVTDAKDKFIETSYDEIGNVRTVQDKRLIITENIYDDMNRLIEVKRADVTTVKYDYDDAGNLVLVTDANNNRIRHNYDARNLLHQTIYLDDQNRQVVRTYDGVGNLKTLTDEEIKVTTYDYDKENRQIYVEFAGEVTTQMYDPLGNLTSITQPEGNCRIMAYDGFNRLTTVVDDPSGPIGTMAALDPRCIKSDELNLVTRYEYDPNNNQRHQYDPGDNHVELTYDSLNRKTNHIQHKPGGNLVTQYTAYDAQGNLTEMVDAKGQTFTYAYDELDRQTDQFFPEAATPYLTITHIQTDYDDNNNVTDIVETKTEAGGAIVTDTTVNTYDEFDRLESSNQRGLTIDYEYDANGNRTRVSTPAGTTTYLFDGRNRLKTATVGSDVTTYTYYPDSKQDTVTYPNGTDVKYIYYPNDRVRTVTNKVTADGGLISSYEYEYSLNGNRTRQIELQDGVSETTTYSYDALDRLLDFTVAGASTSVSEYTYENYNRKTEIVTEDGTRLKSRIYTYDETNWLTRIDDDTDPDNIFTIDYVYDNNGNTILKSNSSLTNQDDAYIYDSRDQLVQAARGPPGGETLLGLYDYNADGLRVRHHLSERGDVDYYYDDTAVIEEHDADDNELLAHYRYADRLLSLDTGTSIQYYHHDALGSTVNLTTDSAAVQVSYKLDPWGHIRSQTGESVNRQVFTGQEHDFQTGLIYYGARYYDPDIARFITQDPYLGETGIPPSLHRYLYAYANPTVYIDLHGYATIAVEDNKVLWGVEKKNGNAMTAQYLPIGEYKKDDGKVYVYLTEEFGGGRIEYKKLKKAAEGFLDYWEGAGVGPESVMHEPDIYGKSSGYQTAKINEFLDVRFDRKGTGYLRAPQKEGLVSSLTGYGEMVQDVHLVGHGLMTPLDFVSKYGFEAVAGFLTSKAGIQLARKLKGPIKRIAEKVSERFKRGATEAVEEGFEYADDYAEGQASGWYCDRCPSASNSGFNSLDPTKVGFSQNSVSFHKVDRITGKRYTFDDLVNSMKNNGWQGDPVDVVKMPDGVFTSIDNTRVLAARKAGIKIQARIRSADEVLSAAEIRRFTVKGFATPKTWGDAINIRIQNQSGGFGMRYPNGSLYDPKVK